MTEGTELYPTNTCHDIRTWIDLTQNVHICYSCYRVIWKSQTGEHLRQHDPPVSSIMKVCFEFSQSLDESYPTKIYICYYCKCIFLGIQYHIGTGCPGMRRGLDSPRFSIIKDPDTIRTAIESSRANPNISVIACCKCSQVFMSIEAFNYHYQTDHLGSVKKTDLLERLSNAQLSTDIATIVNQLVQKDLRSKMPVSNIESENHKSTPKIQIPRPRSRLKSLASIDEDTETLNNESYDDDPITDDSGEPTDLIPSQPSEYSVIELRYIDVLYGRISLPKHFLQLLLEDTSIIQITTYDTSFNGRLLRESAKIQVGEPLVRWFAQNKILAGCYVSLYLPDEDGAIYIRYSRKQSIIHRCLLASWDEKDQRVVLRYEDVTVNVECSKHLFRSLVNLDDTRVLKYMARLHGSIFDVLYLGMRDLFRGGVLKVHYFDLHNMVIDKRLHPQLGSIAAVLSKNSCFLKLGRGYWSFEPDQRIERILPEALLPEHYENSITEVDTIQEDVSVSLVELQGSASEQHPVEDEHLTPEYNNHSQLSELAEPSISESSEVIEPKTLKGSEQNMVFIRLYIQQFVERIIASIRKLVNRF